MVSEKNTRKHLYTACCSWYETAAGEFALQKLNEKISESLIDIFGYFAFESGALLTAHDFLQTSRVDTCFSLGCHADNASVVANMEALPFDYESVDLMVLSHVLECSTDPHQVLREIDRVLVADGHCIFIGFNPLALLQSRRSFCGTQDDFAKPNLYGVRRVRDWLSLLDWKVNDISYVSFRAKFMRGKLFEKMAKMEEWGSLYWPIFGNLYIIHAQKQVLQILPHKRKWVRSRVLPSKVTINPTPRSTQTRDQE